MLIVIAILVFIQKSLLNSVLMLGLFSLIMTLCYINFGALDVAITEAAVGVAISTLIFLAVIKVVGVNIETNNRKLLYYITAIISSVVILFLIFINIDTPLLGDILSPIHSLSANHYVSESYKEIGIPNMVTAILASYRGFDTLGEVFVIFTAGISVFYIIKMKDKHDEK